MPVPKHMQLDNAIKMINGRGLVSEGDETIQFTIEDICDAATLIISTQQYENEELSRLKSLAWSKLYRVEGVLRKHAELIAKLEARRNRWRGRYESLLQQIGGVKWQI